MPTPNPDVTSLDVIERRLGSASREVPVATGGHDARGALAPAPGLDHRELVAQVLHAGPKLPERLRRRVLDAGPAIVPALLDLAEDEEASLEDAPSEGYGPIHAVELLCDLRASEAVEPLFGLLISTDPLTILHDALIRRLPDLGAVLVEPGLRHLEGLDGDLRSSVLAVLARAGVRDERIFAALVAHLRGNAQSAAMGLAQYGDPRAVPHLQRALVGVRLEGDDNPFGAGQDVIELIAAVEALGGEASAAGHAQMARVTAMRNAMFAPLRSALAAPRAGATRPGRNDPCPCGSGRKYKKCCLGKA